MFQAKKREKRPSGYGCSHVGGVKRQLGSACYSSSKNVPRSVP
jgi:hypothetical protein